MNSQPITKKQFIITEIEVDSGTRWFGRIPGSDDGHGNEIDCCLYTPEQALASLLEQAEEGKGI